MKKIKVLLFILATYSFAEAQEMKGMDMKKETKQQAVTYTCPMHPEIHATKPGNCPKCGMKLIKEKPKVQATLKTNKTIAEPTKKDSTKEVTYTCPMHPDIHSLKPGNCPKCGMKLIKEQANEKHDHTKQEPSSMDMSKDTATQQPMNMNNMKMEDHNAGQADEMTDMQKAKANLGLIKTVTNNEPPHTVRYDLYITDTLVTFGKKSKRAIAVNGQIPMPTLTFTEGDTAEIYVHNELNEENITALARPVFA